MKRRLKAGMVGGGRDAFIGGVHRMAMRLDGKIDLVAGAFSSNPEKSKLSGEDLFLDPKRVYADYRTMAAEEAKLPVGERIDFVSVVTPNRTHVPVSKAFLEAGFNVVCDKPLAFNLEEALSLREVVKRTGKIFALTHNYTGYPMVKQARELFATASSVRFEGRCRVSAGLAQQADRPGGTEGSGLAHQSGGSWSLRLSW